MTRDGDMTSGSISKNIIFFSIPVLITTICQTLFTTIDSILVGQFVGASALGSVNSCTAAVNLFMILANGFSIGYRIVVGQVYGAHRLRHVREAITTSIVLMGITSVLITALGVFGGEPMLRAQHTVPELLPDAVTYMRLTFAGISLIIFCTGLNNIFYALGETMIPLYFQLASMVLNILLDVVLLKFLHLGVAGVSLGGIITRSITCLPLFFLLFRKIKSFPKAYHKFDKTSCRKILAFGLPSCLANAVGAIQQVLMTSLINSFGTAVVTGSAIANNISNFFYMFVNTVAQAAGTFCSQNFGAHRVRRIRNCAWICMAICFAYSVLIFVIVHFFGTNLVHLFLSADTEPVLYNNIASFARVYLTVMCYAFFIYGVGHVVNEVLRSVNKVKITVICSTLQALVRLAVCYALAGMIGSPILYWSIPVAWLAHYGFSMIYFLRGKWVPHFKGVHNKLPELDKNRETLRDSIVNINQ